MKVTVHHEDDGSMWCRVGSVFACGWTIDELLESLREGMELHRREPRYDFIVAGKP